MPMADDYGPRRGSRAAPPFDSSCRAPIGRKISEAWSEAANSQVIKGIMYRKHLDVVELREKAFTARQKAVRARLLAARAADKPAVFEEEAANLEAKAVELQRRMEQLEAEPDTLVTQALRSHRAAQ